jgi:hypothetical protein
VLDLANDLMFQLKSLPRRAHALAGPSTWTQWERVTFLAAEDVFTAIESGAV